MDEDENLVHARISSPRTESPVPLDIDVDIMPPGSPPREITPDMLTSTPEKRGFWVSPPPLSMDQKNQYQEISMDTLEVSDEEDELLVAIVGEIRLGTDLYYFVEQNDGIVRRHLAREFKISHSGLVDVYRERKDRGSLEEFDPTSPRIHPNDRVNVAKKYPSRSRTQRRNTVESEEEEEEDDEGTDSQHESDSGSAEDSFYESEEVRQPSRRSVRVAASSAKENYRDKSESSFKRRASDVDKRHTEETDDSSLSSSSEEASIQKTPRKSFRGRFSRPAYGNVRHVADLSDDDSEDELAPLHTHRRECEKCGERAAHELLAAFYNRKKKRGGSRKAKGDADDEVERLLQLGGWIRCLKCCIANHWSCLSTLHRGEIIRASRAKDEEAEASGFKRQKRESLDAYDTTDFICDYCMKGGICMFCMQTAVVAEAPPKGQPDAPVGNAAEVKNADKSVLSNGNITTQQVPSVVLTSVVTPDKNASSAAVENSSVTKVQTPEHLNNDVVPQEPKEKRFRCRKCKRLAHYEHLPEPDSEELLVVADIARYYQTENDWQCPDCASFVDDLDKILAWRPFPANALETPRSNEVADYKANLPREYLVKWAGRSYRRLSWVPHMWLLSTSVFKLRSFLATGPKVRLLDTPNEDADDKSSHNNLMVADSAKETSMSFLGIDANSRASSAPPIQSDGGPPPPLPDAEHRIPLAWKTVDRLLDVRIWDPNAPQRALRRKEALLRRRTAKTKRNALPESDTDDTGYEVDTEAEREYHAARQRGEQPSRDYLETLEKWELRTREELDISLAKSVIWAYVKWEDLTPEDATWDSPPGPSDKGWEAFVSAFQRFLLARDVFVKRKSTKEAQTFDKRPKALFEQKRLRLEKDPDLGQDENLKLMDFQLTGVNWLFRNWWKHQPSILADDMGLGKTVQIACLIGHLAVNFEVYPVLIVVPNSTITNWLREFSRWAPRLTVVSINGSAKSREVVRRYELYHDSVLKGSTNLKFHVLVTTYETVTGKDFGTVFKPVPRWEILIVDEGQRLKNDSGLLFRKLNELKSIHRILLTGTPLNNNIRELFNLMNFLDPQEWDNLNELEEKYEILTEELLNELHETLKPYFLRRTKADVLKLPPKNEVIVPVTMTAIQKEVYKSILSQNLEILGTLTQDSRVNNAIKKLNLKNLLMQLRKCLQHPYLVYRDLEPKGDELTSSDVHRNLLEASAKLRLLHSMLPKLKARGHRVLLFSQFVIGLDIIEDFIAGEGHKFLRLDGTTKQSQRQKDIDAFNSPDSDVFIYLLSTRAGGVGVNLWSADTVIIFDPDFNPHQDLQAISRAHRYGQVKPVLVFKLMVKGAAEERIVQAGKKKLALDHLIVQKMDDDGGADDVQSILTFGAKAIFENSETQEINYTDADIDNLITRTEQGDGAEEASKSQSSFGFAKLWVVEKDAMEEVPEDAPADIQDDGFWSGVLARATAEKAKAKESEVTGRGAKRRAAAVQPTYVFDDGGSPVKKKPKKIRRGSGDPDVEYRISDVDTNSNAELSSPEAGASGLDTDDQQLINASGRPSVNAPPMFTTISNLPQRGPLFVATERRTHVLDPEEEEERYCGLCHTKHGRGECSMTQSPNNLVAYRSMLINESPERAELRLQAVAAIDKNLASRGLFHLVGSHPAFVSNNKGGGAVPRPMIAQSSKGKRRSSPVEAKPSKRPRADTDTDAICDVCDGPFHKLKSCPLVKMGPASIKQAIARLEQDPQKMITVHILQSMLSNS